MFSTENDLLEVAVSTRSPGVKASQTTADVSDINAVTLAVEKITGEPEPIYILINNADIAAFGGFLEM